MWGLRLHNLAACDSVLYWFLYEWSPSMSFHFNEVYGIAVLSAEICGRQMLRTLMSLGLISFTFESWSLLNNFIVKQHWKVILSSYLLYPRSPDGILFSSLHCNLPLCVLTINSSRLRFHHTIGNVGFLLLTLLLNWSLTYATGLLCTFLANTVV